MLDAAAPAHRDLVAVGASAGGVEALRTSVAALPGDLPATVLVALHLPASARSHLDHVLGRSCALPVRHASADLPLVPGEVVVATPDAHLLVVDDRVVLGSGPREHGSRPSHDAVLRSVALARRSRVVSTRRRPRRPPARRLRHPACRSGGRRPCPTPHRPTRSSRRCSPTCATTAARTSPATSGRA